MLLFQSVLLLFSCGTEMTGRNNRGIHGAVVDALNDNALVGKEQQPRANEEEEENFIGRMEALADTSQLLMEAAEFIKRSDRFLLIESSYNGEKVIILYDKKYQCPMGFHMDGKGDGIVNSQTWRWELSHFKEDMERAIYKNFDQSIGIKRKIEEKLNALDDLSNSVMRRTAREQERLKAKILEDIIELVEHPYFDPLFRFKSAESDFDQNLLQLVISEGKVLYGSAERAAKNLIKRLLEKGIDPNHKTVLRRTALHLIDTASEELIVLLEDNGADPLIRDLSGRSAEEYYSGTWPTLKPVISGNPLLAGQNLSPEESFIRKVRSLRTIDEMQAEEGELLRNSKRFSLIEEENSLGKKVKLIYDAQYQQIIAIDIEDTDLSKRERIKKLLLDFPPLLPPLLDYGYNYMQIKLKAMAPLLSFFASADHDKEQSRVPVILVLEEIESSLEEWSFCGGVRFQSPMYMPGYSPTPNDFNLIHMLVYFVVDLRLKGISWREDAEAKARMLIEILVKRKGLSINYKTFESQYTALHLAKIGGHEELAEFLIGLGADPEQRDILGLRPDDY